MPCDAGEQYRDCRRARSAHRNPYVDGTQDQSKERAQLGGQGRARRQADGQGRADKLSPAHLTLTEQVLTPDSSRIDLRACVTTRCAARVQGAPSERPGHLVIWPVRRRSIRRASLAGPSVEVKALPPGDAEPHPDARSA